MTTRIRFTLLLCFQLGLMVLLSAQKNITLEHCFSEYLFYPEGGPSFRFMKDGRHYTSLEKGAIARYDVVTRKRDSILLRKEELSFSIQGYKLSSDEQAILLQTNTVPVYRHSVLADYYVFDLKTRKVIPVNEGAPAQEVLLSPDGRKAAFVMNNDLYVRHLIDQRLERVTTDGKTNAIINGLPDWVYEEEFSPVSGDGMKALAWNPDGARLAFLRFDEREVPEMPLTWYEKGMYPRQSSFKYPKVGAANSKVTVHIYDLENAQLAPVPDIKLAPDDYLVRLNWASKFNLVVTRLNRMQDTLDLVLLSPDGLKKQLSFDEELLLQEVDSAYVEVQDHLRFLEERTQYVWASERSGYNHLYLYDFISGSMIRPLTEGSYDVTAFYGVNEQTGKFYYQTATPGPLDRQVWEGDLNGSPARLMTPWEGHSVPSFSPTFDYYTLRWSDANTPPVVTLHERSGRVLDTLTSNSNLINRRKEFGLVNKRFWSFTNSEGQQLNGWMLRPDSLEPGRRYPVLFDIYGGPGSQTVQNQYDGYMGSWHQLLVQNGYIVVSVDNRGTGGRGRDFKKCTQLELGRYETEDQIAAARYLGSLPYVDPQRIGIWGWSFGGYLSTSCVLKGADVFKMAVAVAPVTNWKWYDSAYTERYMHTTADNSKGYETNSPVNYASLLKGDNYLLCHGIADDNVHWQQAVELMNALIKAGKAFDSYSYPNRNHGIYGENATRHLFTKITDFIFTKL